MEPKDMAFQGTVTCCLEEGNSLCRKLFKIGDFGGATIGTNGAMRGTDQIIE
jgi:hypothetical protein